MFEIEGEDMPLSRSSSRNRDLDFESGRVVSSAETPAGVLQDIAIKCGTKVTRNELYCYRYSAPNFMHAFLPEFISKLCLFASFSFNDNL